MAVFEAKLQRVACFYLHSSDARILATTEYLERQRFHIHKTDSYILAAGEPPSRPAQSPIGGDLVGTFWGANVYSSDEVPVGHIFMLPEICADLCRPLGELSPAPQDFAVELS